MGPLFFLHHLCRLNLAHLPNLVADGEKGDGYDNEDGEDEVEEEPGEVFTILICRKKENIDNAQV